MADSTQQLFTLTSDGISLDFFNLLWTKDELNFGPSINIPDTIVFKMGTPSNWYFTASNGRVKRKNRQNLMNARIEEVIAHKESLICERKDLMHNKMAKAEAKRQEYLNFICLSFILLLLFIAYF